MADLIVALGILAFFGVCLLLVRACDWIIGPDPSPTEALGDDHVASEADSAAVPA